MLIERYSLDLLQEKLIPSYAYEPFPKAARRESWLRLADDIRAFWIAQGETYLHAEWPVLPASLYMDYVRTGNRTRYQEAYFARRKALVRLVLAESMEYNGRFLDDIVNGIWAVCEESTWCWPAHLSDISRKEVYSLPDIDEPVIDLGAGETAALVAWSYYLLGEALDAHCPQLGKRVRRELHVRILDSYEREDNYWWMSFQPDMLVNNWNPWCNSNCLAVLLLIEEDERRRVSLVHKALRSLDRFIASYKEDGGCDEGPAYWGRAAASLYDALQLLHSATDGAVSVFDDTKIRNMAKYILHMHIGGEAYVNFADSAAKLSVPAGLIAQFGHVIGDAQLQAFGLHAYRQQHEYRHWEGEEIPSLQRMLSELFSMPEADELESELELPLDIWMAGVEVMVARERGGAQGWFLAAKGGHNGESHNHNDIGSFIVYADGSPLWIDAGVGTYTAKTFSPERYSIWTMQSGYHNVPEVNGIEQADGGQYRTRKVRHEADGVVSRLTVDIAPAYPADSGIRQWTRTYTLQREADAPSRIILEEAVQLAEPSQNVVLNWMCAYEPHVHRSVIALQDEAGGVKAHMSYDETMWDIQVETIALEGEKLRAAWGDSLYRLSMTARCPVQSERWQFVLERG
ncbi:heparinase II/III domain-containing protein [Paenibacillus sp. OSY-SE]|uniref:heparinase II/III domain-containing protein n=1 Tax=Paenibacillus sp. OSY-SE TaxID=1196323 RepID=UPI0002F28BFB|nr:heparinase II/III family protein [Paenibacillus sp. OSY-SE]